MKDYYRTLGVALDASPAAIKKAYRSLAYRFHPDLMSARGEHNVPDATDKMVEINEAYARLKDAECRSTYDAARALDSKAATGPESGLGERQSRPIESPTRTSPQPPERRVADLAVACLARVRQELESSTDPLHWREAPSVPGFRWALRASKLAHRYWVLGHDLVSADGATIIEALRAADALLESRRGSFRMDHFLFLMPVNANGSPDELAQVWVQLSRGVRKLGNASSRVSLMVVDVHTSRALLVGARPITDERMVATLQRLRLPTKPARAAARAAADAPADAPA